MSWPGASTPLRADPVADRCPSSGSSAATQSTPPEYRGREIARAIVQLDDQVGAGRQQLRGSAPGRCALSDEAGDQVGA